MTPEEVLNNYAPCPTCERLREAIRDAIAIEDGDEVLSLSKSFEMKLRLLEGLNDETV